MEAAACERLCRTCAAEMNYRGQLLPPLPADRPGSPMPEDRRDVAVQEYRRKLGGAARHNPRIKRARRVVEDGDIFGDGVNVAARLEALAEAGGICVSARVQEDAAGKVDIVFEDLGDQRLKNIARPVRVYRVCPDQVAGGTKRVAISLPALPDKPSVAVLPFTNMSGDPRQEFFSDGIAEDIITALSRYPSLFVIARNSCFTYRRRSIDVTRIGRELGVRYVLEGSMRKAGGRIRVTAQLVEA